MFVVVLFGIFIDWNKQIRENELRTPLDWSSEALEGVAPRRDLDPPTLKAASLPDMTEGGRGIPAGVAGVIP